MTGMVHHIKENGITYQREKLLEKYFVEVLLQYRRYCFGDCPDPRQTLPSLTAQESMLAEIEIGLSWIYPINTYDPASLVLFGKLR